MALIRLTIAAAAAALVACSQASGSSAEVKRLTARSGSVQATITYRTGAFPHDIRLRIRRSGSLSFDKRFPPKMADLPVKLRVRDLDANGEPEVIAEFYTGGAHCCWYSLVYDYRANIYRSIKEDWGDSEPRLADLNGDGKMEFRSSDFRFAYLFTAFAGSAFPIQIWNYKPGRLVNSTSKFPQLVRKDAAKLWKAYRANLRSQYPDPRGILAAWMADQYLLGHQQSGWTKMRAANARGEFNGIGSGDIWPKGKRYLEALRKELKKLGYAR